MKKHWIVKIALVSLLIVGGLYVGWHSFGKMQQNKSVTCKACKAVGIKDCKSVC